MSILSSLEDIIKRIGNKIIFSQERIGQYGKPFIIYKFRTMEEDSELPENIMDKPPRGDKRLLRYSAFLRRTGIDELPQLYNVAKGQMTFVGPRPLIQSEHKKFPAHARKKREKQKPAIAGVGYASHKPLTPPVMYEMDMAFCNMSEINYTRAQLYFGLRIWYNLITLKQKLK